MRNKKNKVVLTNDGYEYRGQNTKKNQSTNKTQTKKRVVLTSTKKKDNKNKNYQVHNKPKKPTNKTKNNFYKSIDTAPRKTVTKEIIGKTIELKEEVGSGGEGNIYLTNKKNVAAKVFNEKYRPKIQKKIEFIVSLKLDVLYLTYPKSLLYDKNNNFLGYTMRFLDDSFRNLNVIQTPARDSFFKEKITYGFLLKICLQIANTVKMLHKNGIVIGDMKLDNIMINPHGNIYIVDVDSFQFSQKFKCNTITVPYVPPEELTNKNLTKHLRFWHYDSYSLSVIIFQVLTLGTHPYDRLYGGDLISNIKGGYYEYPHPKDNSPMLKFTRKDVYKLIKNNFSNTLQTFLFHHFHKHGHSRLRESRYKPYKISQLIYKELKGFNK